MKALGNGSVASVQRRRPIAQRSVNDVADAIFLLLIVGFFALCVAYIRACDRIIGPDSEFESEELGWLDENEPMDPQELPA